MDSFDSLRGVHTPLPAAGHVDFDEPVDLSGVDAIKWDTCDRSEGKIPFINLGVADMDFAVPPDVHKALKIRAEHPVYMHTLLPKNYFEPLRRWFAAHYDLALELTDFIPGPGTIPAIGSAICAFSSPGDGVLIPAPVYGPFCQITVANGRQAVEFPLELAENGRYRFSAETLERTLAGAAAGGLNVPLLLFCSPHNPGGTVWEREELETLLDFAAKHNIIVVCDEIHADFVFSPRKFVSLASFRNDTGRVVVSASPNKSFNLGGLHASHLVVRDEKLREALMKDIKAHHYQAADIFSLIASRTAYEFGGPWMAEVLDYIEKNIDAAVAMMRSDIPLLRTWKPEGTYLIWVDAAALIKARGLKDEAELAARIEKELRVRMSPGYYFGTGGKNFVRINAACPRARLLEGIDRIRQWAESSG
jgi:cystathionine beta-lyase